MSEDSDLIGRDDLVSDVIREDRGRRIGVSGGSGSLCAREQAKEIFQAAVFGGYIALRAGAGVTPFAFSAAVIFWKREWTVSSSWVYIWLGTCEPGYGDDILLLDLKAYLSPTPDDDPVVHDKILWQEELTVDPPDVSQRTTPLS
jgi:hypothetical protein